MKLSTKSHNKAARVLIYGEPKTGKTQLASSLAHRYKLYYFDLENGFETLLKLPKAAQENVELFSIPDTKVFPIAIETMLKVITGNKVEICEAHGKVSCALCKKDSLPVTSICLNDLGENDIVIVDSLTQLSNSAMNHLTKNLDELYKPEWGDYRNQGQLLDKFLSQVQQAKFNIVCISHVVESQQEDGKAKLFPVCGTTQFSRNTAKYFDHVIYCEMKNKKHMFASSTAYANNVMTGSRLDIAIEAQPEASLLEFFARKLQQAPATPGNVAVNNLKALVK